MDAVREAWNLQRMEKNSFRSRNALLTLYREAEEIPRRKKSPLLRVSTVNSIAFYLMPAVLKKMMSDRDTCSIEFKTGRSSDIYGYVENGNVDVALSRIF